MRAKGTVALSAGGLLAALLLATFFAINLAVLSRVPFSFSLAGLVYAWLLEFSAFGLAYDTIELILCLVLREYHLPSLRHLERCPSVALVCVTCDDVDREILYRLGNQSYGNLEVFILDDSQLPTSWRVIDNLGFRVVRRGSRDGYKAGNLNNWLVRHGSSYDYFIVADADSILPDDFVDKMVRVAEHPQNHQIAIIESIIYPWNDSYPFVKPQATLAPFQRCRRLRLLNRLDSTLSVGHNNLFRTSAILSIGGFLENYIAEDYSTTIKLLQQTKWKCKTASIKSYEKAPANISEYARRQSRWAYQTFQLSSMMIGKLNWDIKLALLRALHYFSMPVVAYIAMFWLIAANGKYWIELGSKQTSSGMASNLLDHPALGLWLSWLMVPIFIRFVLLRREGVPLRDYLRSILFQTALFFATTWPIMRRLTGFRYADRDRFDVTGKSPEPRPLETLKSGGPGILLAWLTLLSFIPVPHYLVLNLVWLIPACLSPFLIHRPGDSASEA